MKRPMNMGKHTSTSKLVRERLENIFNLPGVDRIIIGFSKGCFHSQKDGNLKFQRQEKGKIHIIAYNPSGTTKVVILINDKANIQQIIDSISNNRK